MYQVTCTITLVVNDQGNYPGMIEWAQPRMLTITVSGVNDPPSISLGASNEVVQLREGNDVWLLRDRFQSLVFNDVDRNPVDILRVEASVVEGDGYVSIKYSKGSELATDLWLQRYLCPPSKEKERCPSQHPEPAAIETTIDAATPVVLRALHYGPNPKNAHFAGTAIVNVTVYDLGNTPLPPGVTRLDTLQRATNRYLGLHDTVQLILQLEAVADVPKLQDCKHTSGAGTRQIEGEEDAAIDLCLSIDYSPHENVTIFVRPTPHSTHFSHGRLLRTEEDTGQAVWIVEPEDVSSLKMYTPRNWHGEATVNYHSRSVSHRTMTSRRTLGSSELMFKLSTIH